MKLLFILAFFTICQRESEGHKRPETKDSAKVNGYFSFNPNLNSGLSVTPEFGPLEIKSRRSFGMDCSFNRLFSIKNHKYFLNIGMGFGFTGFSQRVIINNKDVKVLAHSINQADLSVDPVYLSLIFSVYRNIKLNQYVIFIVPTISAKYFIPGYYGIGIGGIEAGTGNGIDAYRSYAKVNPDNRFNYNISMDVGVYKQSNRLFSIRYAINYFYSLQKFISGRYEFFNENSGYFSHGSFSMQESYIGIKISVCMNYVRSR